MVQMPVSSSSTPHALARAGDFNGDGLSDLLFGNPGYTPVRTYPGSGEAYLVYGNPALGTTQTLIDIETLTASQGFVIRQREAHSALGRDLGPAGDTNGDGIDDFLISATEGSTPGEHGRRNYRIYGRENTPGETLSENGATRQVWDITPPEAGTDRGEYLFDYFSNHPGIPEQNREASVTNTGDVNGDGLDDVVFGSPTMNQAYFYFGQTSKEGLQFGLRQGIGIPVWRESYLTLTSLGHDVSGAGDINGDGLADFLISEQDGARTYRIATGRDEFTDVHIGDRVNVIYGRGGPAPGPFNGSIYLPHFTTDHGFVLLGGRGGNSLGHVLASAGDVNGDGLDDFLAGEYRGHDGDGTPMTGRVYLIYGQEDKRSQLTLDLSTLSPEEGLVIQGEPNSLLGVTVASAGDFNGDGLADILIGAKQNNGSHEGRAYLIYGMAGRDGTQFGESVSVPDREGVTRQVFDLEDLTVQSGFKLTFDTTGAPSSGSLEALVSGAGDVNADGYDDILVGGHLIRDDTGTVRRDYVFFGGPQFANSSTAGQSIASAPGDESLIGGPGSDRLTETAGSGVLAFYGGAGDDHVSLSDDTFRRVDGGSGTDTLVLGPGITLDLTATVATNGADLGRTNRQLIRRIETLSLADSSVFLTLDLANVYDITDQRDASTGMSTTSLYLEGAGGQVILANSALENGERKNWEQVATGTSAPDQWRLGNALVLIEDGLTVTTLEQNVQPGPNPDAPRAVTLQEGATVSLDASEWFVDPGDTSVTYRATGRPDWLTFDTTTGLLTRGPLEDPHTGTHRLWFTATDDTGAYARHSLSLKVLNVNEAPVAAASAPSDLGTLTGGMVAAWTVADWLTDPDEMSPVAGERLFYSGTLRKDSDSMAQAIQTIDWLQLDPIFGELVVVPGKRIETGMYEITITATDLAGESASHATSLSIDAFDSFEERNLIPDYFIPEGDVTSWTETNIDLATLFTSVGSSLTFEISETFPDDDAGDLVAATLTGSMLSLAAMVTNTDFGGYELLTVTATDGGGVVRVIDVFSVSVLKNTLDFADFTRLHGFVLREQEPDHQIGPNIGALGDINGDGLDDFLIGETSENGQAYLVYGSERTASPRAYDTPATTLFPAEFLAQQGGALTYNAPPDSPRRPFTEVGDINGDGIADFALGSKQVLPGIFVPFPEQLPPLGVGFLVYGMAGTDSFDLDLATLTPAEGLVLRPDWAPMPLFSQIFPYGFGPEREPDLGRSIAGVGDVNGDGVEDFLVGLPNGDNFARDIGNAFLIYGKRGTDGTQFGTTAEDGRQVLDAFNLTGTNGFIITGRSSEGRLGWSVAGAGDFNGDGLADFVLGAPLADPMRGGGMNYNSGEVYVVFGSTDNPGTASDRTFQTGEGESETAMYQIFDVNVSAMGDGGLTIQGRHSLDKAGYFVSGGGDFNGDGLDDILIGTGILKGISGQRAYLVYGTTATLDVLDLTSLTPDAGFVVTTRSTVEQLRLQFAGDINGDGLADILASDSKFGEPDRTSGDLINVYVLFGDDGSRRGDLNLPNALNAETGLVLQKSLDPDAYFGQEATGAGDLNGDGFDDLLLDVYSPMADNTDGGAYVFYGSSRWGGVAAHDQTPTSTSASLIGGAGNDTLTQGAGNTVFYGGAGDDSIRLDDASSLRRVDGGHGDDTLVLGMDVDLDLTDATVRSRILSIETLSLTDATTSLTLDLASVYALTDQRDNGGLLTDPGQVLLRLEGTAGTVTLDGTWTPETDVVGTADSFTLENAIILADNGLVA